METKANYLLIGAFTLAGIAGIIGLFLWFARVELDRQFNYYDVRFSSVSGLSEASDVRFAGLPVGQVVDVRLAPDLDGTILVRVEVDAITPVRADSIATIESQGVTGVSFVAISAGTATEPMLNALSIGEVPEITPGRSVIQTLSEDAPLLIEETLAVIQEVNELFGTENQQRITTILQNVQDASGTFTTTLENFSEVADSVTEFADKIGEFNDVIVGLSDDLEGVLQTADTALASVGNLAYEAETLLINGSETLVAVEQTFNEAETYIAEDLTATTDELRATIVELRAQIDTLSTDAQDLMTTFDTMGVTATDRLIGAEATLASINDMLTQVSGAAGSVDGAATGFNTLLETEAAPMIADVRAAVSQATAAVTTIANAAENDLPEIVADVRNATRLATQTIADVGEDLSGASGRLDTLSLTAQTALTEAIETFQNANVTLEAVNGAMETADRALAVADRTFAGADRVINEDITGIVNGLETSLASLNTAIGQVSDDIPSITGDLRAAGQSAQQAFASLERTIESAGPSVSEFSRTALPLYTRLADEARGLIDNLDRLTTQIQRDPARFFLNQQSPEFQR